MDINDWKKNKKDPLPSKYDYPNSNNKSNMNSELKNNYNYYEKMVIFLGITVISNIIIIILKSKFKPKTKPKLNPKPNLISKFKNSSFIVASNLLLFLSVNKLLKNYYKYDRNALSKSTNIQGVSSEKEYHMRVIGYGFQKYISTPSIFKGKLKDKFFPQHKIFNQNFEIIKKEVNGLLKYVDHIPLTHEAIPGNEYISRDYDKTTGKGWKTCAIKLEGSLTEIGKLHCPKLSKLVDIPIIRNATVSILEGKRHIPIHCGYFKGYIRYLFCVIEPKKDHCFIYINKEKYIFKENEGILWDDLFPHEVYNMSNDYRVCIYLDLLRKLDNKLLDFLLKKIVNMTKYATLVSKLNASYEKKPITFDDFPKHPNFD